jgi:hypothetical protein
MHQTSTIFSKMAAGVLAAIFAVGLTSLASFAASEFEGVWKVKDTSGKPFEITLSANGGAKANVSGKDMTGLWTADGDVAVINWNTGWTTKISKKGDHYEKTTWDKGKPTDGPPTDSSEAEKAQ